MQSVWTYLTGFPVYRDNRKIGVGSNSYGAFSRVETICLCGVGRGQFRQSSYIKSTRLNPSAYASGSRASDDVMPPYGRRIWLAWLPS